MRRRFLHTSDRSEDHTDKKSSLHKHMLQSHLSDTFSVIRRFATAYTYVQTAPYPHSVSLCQRLQYNNTLPLRHALPALSVPESADETANADNYFPPVHKPDYSVHSDFYSLLKRNMVFSHVPRQNSLLIICIFLHLFPHITGKVQARFPHARHIRESCLLLFRSYSQYNLHRLLLFQAASYSELSGRQIPLPQSDVLHNITDRIP